MKISVIVLTYNSNTSIRACLDSILASKPDELIVVDNASTDDTLKAIKGIKGLKLIALSRNIGYNGGNQAGIEASTGDIVIILNPDTVVPKDFCTLVAEMVKKHPEAGLLGCGIKNPDGSVEITASKFPTFGSLLYELSSYQHFFPHSRAYRKYLMLDWDRLSARPVDAVSGACTILTRAFINQFHQLDSGYFLYWEELDLGQVAAKHRVPVIYDPMVFVTHTIGESTKQVSANKLTTISLASRDRYIRKYHGGWYLALFKASCWAFNQAWRIGRHLKIGYNK